MTHFEEKPKANESFFDEEASIAASQKLTEWMGVLLADHDEHVEQLEGDSRLLRLRSVEDSSKIMSARITAGVETAYPRLELTVPKDKHSDFITEVYKPERANRYYFIRTVLRDNQYGRNDVQPVDEPHPITNGEVNNMLKFAQLRPVQAELPDESADKVRTLAGYVARLFGRK